MLENAIPIQIDKFVYIYMAQVPDIWNYFTLKHKQDYRLYIIVLSSDLIKQQ